MTANAQMNGRSMYCVPNALERILLYAYPADSVNCLLAQNHLRSAASKQLHYRLAVPHFGVLLIKWPLCFGNGRRTGTFISLLRRNLNRQLQNEQLLPINEKVVAETIETFLRGYEEMMLDELCSNTHLYSALTTLVVDFSVNKACSAFFPENFKCACDWEQWACTINAIANECSSKLLRLFIVTNPKVQGDLSAKFYVALKLDKILARTRNLQSLYMPSISDVGRAYDAISERNAWQALYDLPPEHRLPNLKRIFVNKCSDLRNSGRANDFPKLNTTDVTVHEFSHDSWFKNEVASPDAFSIPYLPLMYHWCESDCREFLFGLWDFEQRTEPVLCRLDGRRAVIDTGCEDIDISILAEQILIYVNDILVPQYYNGTNDALRDMRLARYHHGEALHPTFAVVFDLHYGPDAIEIVPDLIQLLTNRTLQARVRFELKIDCSDKITAVGFGLSPVLHSFKFEETQVVMTDELMRHFRLKFHIKLCSTLRDWFGEKSGDLVAENGGIALPRIKLIMEPPVITIVYGESQRVESVEVCVQQIAAQVHECMQTFVRDAVDACSRRNASFFMYQSLETVDFRFKVRLVWRRENMPHTMGEDGDAEIIQDHTWLSDSVILRINQGLETRFGMGPDETSHEGSEFFKTAFEDDDLDLFFPISTTNNSAVAALPALRAAKVSASLTKYSVKYHNNDVDL